MINESHFNERIKCPKDFSFICRSERISSTVPRGGVAIFQNKSWDVQLEDLHVKFRDCAVCKISNTDFIIAAPYIPPVNSKFYDVICFNNLELLYNSFKSYNLLIIGDLNCRIGTPSFINQTLKYNINPDTIINSHGKKLLSWVNDRPDMIILNGLKISNKTFESNFTCFRGKLRSQNDIGLSNRVECIQYLKILPKTVYSDHCPVALRCCVTICPSLDVLYKISKGCFNDDHYDINRRLKRPLKLSRMNIVKAINNLENYARELKIEMSRDTNNNTMSTKISECLYDACKQSYDKRHKRTMELSENMSMQQLIHRGKNVRRMGKLFGD